jgi:hypothetical protein
MRLNVKATWTIVSVLSVLLFVINLIKFNQTAIKDLNPAGQESDVSLKKIGKQRKTYLHLNTCTVEYDTASRMGEHNLPYSYSIAADESLHAKEIVRGLLFYFETRSVAHFMPEFKWVFRSWLEMLKTSPKQWHTDLIVFLNVDHVKLDPNLQQFEQLGCLVNKPRQTKTAKSMCILIDYKSMKDRIVPGVVDNIDDLYNYLYNHVDVFSDDAHNLNKFYAVLKDLDHYGYTDSILVAFESYKYVKDLYDFVIRADLDIFITPKFGKWLPRHCSDFIVGNGGYSTAFNTRRLGRIAAHLGLSYESKAGLGSTWYSTPRQFRIVSYYTLVSMVYISNYEFTAPERKSQIGTLNWPDWHYGVLLLYGQHLAVNHLMTQHINFVKLEEQFDVPSSSTGNIDSVLQIHTCNNNSVFLTELLLLSLISFLSIFLT